MILCHISFKPFGDSKSFALESSQRVSHPHTVFDQLGSGAHGTGSLCDRVREGKTPGPDAVQRPQGPFHASYNSSCNSSDELAATPTHKPKGSRETPSPAIRRKSSRLWRLCLSGQKKYIAVLPNDGQGGALLREVAKLDKFGSDTKLPWTRRTGTFNS